MKWLRTMRTRFVALFRKRELDADMNAEMRSHIEMRTQQNIEAGMNPEEARYAALRRFGWTESIKEDCREQRGVRWLENLAQDIRFGARQLRKNPGFTAVAVLTLALGIGANTAIFSFVNAILLRPLPYKEPEKLVMVFENHLGNSWRKGDVGAPMLGEWRKQSTVFEGLAARGRGTVILTGQGQPESLVAARFSANIFSLLGVKPLFGRNFLPEEETYGKHFVVLLSHELWQRRFGGDPNVVGQSITLEGEPYTVIGVMPPRTFFPERNTQVWVPLAFSPNRLSQRHAHSYLVYGRLKPGVTLAQANAEMELISKRLEAANTENKGWGAEVHSLHEIMVGDTRRVLLVLLGSVGLVLLIGCANIANLVLARSVSRTREFAIRAALGAGRGQMIRQLLTESLLLAALGGLAGTLFASLALDALVRFSPPDLPRVWEGIHIDGRTLSLTALAVVFTGLFFGLVPALQFSNFSLARDLNESSRGASAGVLRQRLRGGLVVSEVALSVMLLVGAGLMIRSFSRLLSQPLGFRPEHVVRMNLILPDKKYPEQTERERFFDQVLARAQALPGVQSAGLVMGLPLGGDNNALAVWIPEAPKPKPGEAVAAGYAQVSPGYFRTMNIPLLQGRDFTDQDRTNTTPVLVVDETFVKNFKFGTNVFGRRVHIGESVELGEIIGVIKDVKRTGMADAVRGEMYRSYKQLCWGGMTLVVRTQRDPAEVTRAIRTEVDAIDKDQPIQDVGTMTQLVASSVAPRRLSTQLLVGFAGVAMLLAALGLYGVLAYNVTQRTQEIGIRMALGARKQDVLSLVIQNGMKLALIGVGVGVAGALALTRVMERLLFDVKPADPLTFTCVSVLLLGVALVACWLPARRAARVDPMVALRQE
ncbi:MAG: ABC transporter permease [Verrucomicrobia bacterium]|nr:ABC transporter permease [Verrucomicrobiota bacterium]